MRDVVRAQRESGAIDGLTAAVYQSIIVARDTTREISETAKELKDHGVIEDTATVVQETAAVAREIGETARDSTTGE